MTITLRKRSIPYPAIGAGTKPQPYGKKDHFTYDKAGSWHSCREQLHYAMTQPDGFYYGAPDTMSLIALIDWVEDTLNLKPTARCALYLCSKKKGEEVSPMMPIASKAHIYDTVYIKMSNFWKEDTLRYYFLTALCRAARLNWGHPLDAIFETKYFKSTPVATAMFLNGYTVRTGVIKDINSNWVQLMSSPSNVKLLARPKSKKQTEHFVNRDPRPNLLPSEKCMISTWTRSRKNSNDIDFSF